MASSLEGRRSPNNNLYEIFLSSVDTSADSDEEYRIELDSHANMVVVGMHSYILNYTGRTAEVIPFTSSYEAQKNFPIVDAIIAYHCPLSGKTYLLVFHNDLFVSSMKNNLILPFILGETNIVVNEVPKIKIPDPD